MANNNLVKFFEMVKSDRSIRDEIANAANEEGGIEKAIQVAKKRGITFTADEFSSYMSQVPPPNRELSDTELANVAGGMMPPPRIASPEGDQIVAQRCQGSGFWCYIYR